MGEGGETSVVQMVRTYYGQTLQNSADLKTSACCSAEALPPAARRAAALIEPEILSKFYGCGSPIPPLLEGRHILDLGCGTGRDVYIMSHLAGPDGFVTGVDMTPEQLEVARRHQEGQARRFGFEAPNTRFLEGRMEALGELGLESDTVDLVTSNCVLNLAEDKRAVFAEIFRVLKPGGELFFADVFTGRRVPEGLQNDPLLRGECLGGALYIEDFRRLLREVGCPDYRVLSRRRITLDNPEVEARVGMVDFYSLTVRAFKLPALEDLCEDYGQTAIYRGTIPEHPHHFDLDDHHRFITGKPMLVCGNTASMLAETRYGEHFQVNGDRSVHFGPFDCAPAWTHAEEESGSASGGACC